MFSASSRMGNYELYDGATCPKKFFEQFNITCLFEGWTDEDNKASICLKAFLKGKALIAYDTAWAAQKRTLEDFCTAIVAACDKPIEAKMAKFTERKQKHGESLSKYSQELSLLLQEAMPTLGLIERQSIVRSQLITNAPNNIKEMLKLSATLGGDAFNKYVNQCDDISSSNVHASTLIKDEPIDSNYMNSNGRFNNSNNRNNNSYTNRNAYSYNRSPISNGSHSSNYFDGQCHACDQRGHRLVDCPQRAAEVKNSLRSNSSRRGSYSNSNNTNQFRNGPSNNQQNGGYRPNYKYSPNNQSSHVNQATANNNNLDAMDINQDHLSIDQGFPWFNNAENNMLNMEINSNETKLLRITIELKLFGVISIYPHTLLDCGSNYSFLSPTMLTDDDWKVLNKFDCEIIRQQFKINGAVGQSMMSTCKIVKANVKIGSWKGEWSFVVSSMVTKHQCLLGRDFFQAHGMIIDHGKDVLKVKDHEIHISQLEARPSRDYNNEISALEERLAQLQILKVRNPVASATAQPQIELENDQVGSLNDENEALLFNMVQPDNSGKAPQKITAETYVVDAD